MSDKMTPAEHAALQSLRDGDLKPLASLMYQGESKLHPLIQREVAKMIFGWGDVEYSISTKLRPGTRVTQTRKYRHAVSSLGQRVAGRIEHLRQEERMLRARATEKAADEFGIRFDTADSHYKKYGKLARLFRRVSGG